MNINKRAGKGVYLENQNFIVGKKEIKLIMDVLCCPELMELALNFLHKLSAHVLRNCQVKAHTRYVANRVIFMVFLPNRRWFSSSLRK